MSLFGFGIRIMPGAVRPWPSLFNHWRLANAWEFRIGRVWVTIPLWYCRSYLEMARREWGIKSRRELRRWHRRLARETKHD